MFGLNSRWRATDPETGSRPSAVGFVGTTRDLCVAINASASSSGIVRTLAARFAQRHRPEMPKIPNQPGEAQAALVEGCKAAAALVAEKAPGEAAAFARFLLDTARASANASREGGFIGIGIAKVSEGEQLALANLALALGLPE